jgi:HlyD family secretion protein
MSADIEVLVTTLRDVLAVPSQAIVERDGKKQVYVVGGNSLVSGDRATVHLRPVEIGESNWVSTEVRTGLKAGELVVTTPEAEGLKNGVKVRIE